MAVLRFRALVTGTVEAVPSDVTPRGLESLIVRAMSGQGDSLKPLDVVTETSDSRIG